MKKDAVVRLKVAASCMLSVRFGVLALVVFAVVGCSKVYEYDRRDFPPGFVFGASSSAYQVEGAAFEDGRKPSIFDTYAHSGHVPGNGDVTSDEYHKYKEDVELMVETGLDAYRFSISWSRLIPNGRGSVNPKGLDYYNNLINTLISKGIQPHVTLMHSDIPQVLEDEYGGFISPKIIEDFVAYANVCFREFGDRVLHWNTFNEANIFIFGGYDVGNSPPCRCSFPFGLNCIKGNSTIEPYLAAHHLLLSHASTTRLYKENYQRKQLGFVGINLYAFNFIPFSNTTDDVTATIRAYDFFIGWFMEPLVHGEYPAIMKKNVGNRLPEFTQKEKELLKKSFDFIGLNYYTVIRVKDNSASLAKEPRDYLADQATSWLYLNDSNPFLGNPFFNTPWGLQGVLEHFKQVYSNPPIFIHENGQFTDHSTDYYTLLNDQLRVEYLQGHIGAVLDAVRNGSDTKGYFVWSFLDMYELMFGNKRTFGLFYVDFNDPRLTRHPKLSQKWYARFLKAEEKSLTGEETLMLASTLPQESKESNIAS